MNQHRRFISFITFITSMLWTVGAMSHTTDGHNAMTVNAPLDTAIIEHATGLKGVEHVFKISFPRNDLDVMTAGVKMTPPMGLTSWAAFKKVDQHVMMMGDTVLLEDQVNPVMSVALANGLQVTALHNHFFWEKPRVFFMHIAGTGTEAQLADAVAKVYAKLRDTSGGKGDVIGASLSPTDTSLDPQKITAILGIQGTMAQGVYKVIIGRTTKMGGHDMGNAMGVNTWAAFVGSDDNAVVMGDFAMYENELQDVLKALRSANIGIVAIHNHMTGEEPRVVFLHFWGVGSTSALARGIQKALETQNH